MLTNNVQGRKLRNIFSEFDMHNQIDKPTCLHRSIDAIFSNVQAHKFTVIDTSIYLNIGSSCVNIKQKILGLMLPTYIGLIIQRIAFRNLLTHIERAVKMYLKTCQY